MGDRDRRIRVMLAIDGMGIGGAEMVVRDLARMVNRDRFKLSVCCTKGMESVGEQLLAEGVDIFVLPQLRHAGTDYLSSIKMWWSSIRRRVDVLHTHAGSALLDAAVARILNPRIRLLHTFHFGNYPHVDRRTLQLERWASRHADGLVAVGWRQRDAIAEAFGMDTRSIRVIWNGTAPPAVGSSGDEFRQRVNPGRKMLVGTLAKLIPQKGLEDLLAVARWCKDRGWPMQFVVLGEGPLRADLEQRRKDLDVADVVTLAGWVPQAATVALPAFDVFFQPSRWEAMSIAVLEAMAAGKAIAATEVGDNARMIENDRSGVIFQAGDIPAMATALHGLLDPQARLRIGRAARQRYEEQFTLERMVAAYEDCYSSFFPGRS